jgi:CRISPR/Cas system-associated exonuclease Cas4 (RecB family)
MSEKEIIDKIIEGKAKKIKVYPQYVTRASEVGHPCERYLVYSITNWADRTPYEPELQFIFEGGNMVEDMAVKDFEEAGFKVYRGEPDKALANRKPAMTGHYDFRVDFGDGKPKTIECKGLSKYDWDYLNTYEDFFTSKKVYIRKYPAQLQMYLYFKAEDLGYFYLKSIPAFQPKLIPVRLDYDFVEEILQKTERVENHVKDRTLPERINDLDVCTRCAFFNLCLPEIKRQPMEIIDDGELEAMLARWDELKPLEKEYKDLDKQLKESFRGSEKLLIGNYLIEGQLVERKAYIPKPVEASSYWKYKINKLESVGTD